MDVLRSTLAEYRVIDVAWSILFNILALSYSLSFINPDILSNPMSNFMLDDCLANLFSWCLALGVRICVKIYIGWEYRQSTPYNYLINTFCTWACFEGQIRIILFSLPGISKLSNLKDFCVCWMLPSGVVWLWRQNKSGCFSWTSRWSTQSHYYRLSCCTEAGSLFD